MTIHVDEHVARGFHMLRNSEFAPLMLYLGSVRAEILEQLATQGDDRNIHVLQGKAQALKDFMDKVTQSPVLMQKLKR